MWHDQTGLPWVGTSPAMPHLSTATVYPAPACSRASTSQPAGERACPSSSSALPWIDPEPFCDALNDLELPGVYFRPTSFEPALRYDPRWGGDHSELSFGAQFTSPTATRSSPVRMGFHLVAALRRLYPGRCEWQPHFDVLMGSSTPASAWMRAKTLSGCALAGKTTRASSAIAGGNTCCMTDVDQVLAAMTPEQKAGPGHDGGAGPDGAGRAYTALTPRGGRLVADLSLGGVVSSSAMSASRRSFAALSADLRKVAAALRRQVHRAGLFIAIDQEGGRVVRIARNVATPRFRATSRLGRPGDPANARVDRRAARIRTDRVRNQHEPRAVLDINNNPRNQVIGTSPSARTPASRSSASSISKACRPAGIMAVEQALSGQGRHRGRLPLLPAHGASRAGVAWGPSSSCRFRPPRMRGASQGSCPRTPISPPSTHGRRPAGHPSPRS